MLRTPRRVRKDVRCMQRNLLCAEVMPPAVSAYPLRMQRAFGRVQRDFVRMRRNIRRTQRIPRRMRPECGCTQPTLVRVRPEPLLRRGTRAACSGDRSACSRTSSERL